MRSPILLSLVLAPLSLLACNGSIGGGGSVDDSDEFDQGVFPVTLYTGVDGAAEFVAPAVYRGPGDGLVEWSIANPAMARLSEGDASHRIVVEPLAAGTTELIAVIDGQSYSSPVQITQFSPAEVEGGRTLYTTRQCRSCHGTTSGPDHHSPTLQVQLSDEEVINTMTEGISHRSGQLIGQFHAFGLPASEARQILAYLRSLPQRGWPAPEDEDEF